MLEALTQAASSLASLNHFIWMLTGVCVGLVVGVIPGLGGIAGLSLLIPFVFGMEPTAALGMLVGLVAVIPTSDTFASVLMGIPGSSASQATVLDGFPLARKGQAARALSAAFASSLFGGVIGALILTGFVLIARPLILTFGAAELFMLALFGLSMVAALAGRSLAKGIAAGAVGLLAGSIGAAPATGEFRMIFDFEYLYDGIPLVVMGLGLFAIPEIVDLLRKNRSIAANALLGQGWIAGLRDWTRNTFLSVRCAGFGAIIGAIPGLGGSVVDWITYGHAVQTCKKNPEFGKGDIRGVIAPESANNAMQGGTLLPTILFGIPGSGSMAVFLGGMILIGIEPGPALADAELGITYTIIWSLAVANIMGAGICFLLAPPIARLTTVPFAWLAPCMIALVCFAAFQATRDIADLVALVAIGALGILMKRFGWPRPALLIGYVLAPQAETYFYQALQFNPQYGGFGMLLRPGVIVIAALTLASLWFGLRRRVKEIDTVGAGGEEKEAHATRFEQIGFTLAMAGFCLLAWSDASSHTFLGRIFPAGAAALGLVFCLALAWRLWRGPSRHPAFFDLEITGDHVGKKESGRMWSGWLWLAGLIAGAAVVGFYAAMILFFLAFLRWRTKATWTGTLCLTGAASAFLLGLAWMLSLHFPRGLVQNAYDLPWPFR
ncbi:tripartite tricarboxylate transporter permease [Thioalkalivibrio sp. HK1]|uniref:tripartite tricarboxylate transporter permease n=1 Tax=Thioalkalivibrio sp. HK1 TaxID=1469245 RepID=UPI00046FB831|nr:tripartite tricarboxylate transporter permease [Thioalkalivibrio sp. HK1]